MSQLELGEWANLETGGTVFGVQVTRYRVVGEFAASETDNNKSLSAPEDTQWVDARAWIRNTGSKDVGFSYRQWSLLDFRGVEHAPHSKAMRRVRDTMPAEAVLAPNDGERYRVIFATVDPDDLEFLVEPYGDNGARRCGW